MRSTKTAIRHSRKIRLGRPLRSTDVTSRRSYSSRSKKPKPDRLTENEAPQLSHLTEAGEAHMISISQKTSTFRQATAVATLLFSKETTYSALDAARNKKGDAIAVARIAAIQAAKKTADSIPLAHPSLGITGITVDIDAFEGSEKRYTVTKHGTETTGGNDGDTGGLREVSNLDARFGGVEVKATVACEGKTGVEMEALTAATMGAMTLYDMLKGVDKAMVVMGCRVIKKEGGKSGGWEWDEKTNQLVKSI